MATCRLCLEFWFCSTHGGSALNRWGPWARPPRPVRTRSAVKPNQPATSMRPLLCERFHVLEVQASGQWTDLRHLSPGVRGSTGLVGPERHPTLRPDVPEQKAVLGAPLPQGGALKSPDHTKTLLSVVPAPTESPLYLALRSYCVQCCFLVFI